MKNSFFVFFFIEPIGTTSFNKAFKHCYSAIKERKKKGDIMIHTSRLHANDLENIYKIL